MRAVLNACVAALDELVAEAGAPPGPAAPAEGDIELAGAGAGEAHVPADPGAFSVSFRLRRRRKAAVLRMRCANICNKLDSRHGAGTPSSCVVEHTYAYTSSMSDLSVLDSGNNTMSARSTSGAPGVRGHRAHGERSRGDDGRRRQRRRARAGHPAAAAAAAAHHHCRRPVAA